MLNLLTMEEQASCTFLYKHSVHPVQHLFVFNCLLQKEHLTKLLNLQTVTPPSKCYAIIDVSMVFIDVGMVFIDVGMACNKIPAWSEATSPLFIYLFLCSSSMQERWLPFLLSMTYYDTTDLQQLSPKQHEQNIHSFCQELFFWSLVHRCQ